MNSRITDSIFKLVMAPDKRLDDTLSGVLITGGKEKLPDSVEIKPIFHFENQSGFNYWVDDTLCAQLYLSLLYDGSFCVYRRCLHGGSIQERNDRYNSQGEFIETLMNAPFNRMQVISEFYDTERPILNYIYLFLSLTFKLEVRGDLLAQSAIYLNSFLKKFGRNKTDKELGLRHFDKEHTRLLREIANIQNKNVLKWSEKNELIGELKEKVTDNRVTKKRAFKKGLLFSLFYFKSSLLNYFSKYKNNSANAFVEFLYKYTIGIVVWFIQTVRDNLGYSVALALYAPFTYYFITQPINPHAMNVVGMVRNTSISLYEKISQNFPSEESLVRDEVSTQYSSVQKQNTSIDQGNNPQWNKRMSEFKAYQIDFETDLIFATRMGRIEQMENQLSFPLIADMAWTSLVQYKMNLTSSLTINKKMNKALKRYLEQELENTNESLVYIFKKFNRFLKDHPYIVQDIEGEQPKRDHYISNVFKQVLKYANYLSQNQEVKAFNKDIENYKSKVVQKIETGSIVKNLEENSKLFANKDLFNSDKLRDDLERTWETIFLQQNKKQEASSFGLSTYVWSVRNALWSLQNIYTLKNFELSTLMFKYANVKNNELVIMNQDISDGLEKTIHLMTLEFVSVKKEMEKTLSSEKDVIERKKIINNILSALKMRDRLLKKNEYVSKVGKQ